MSKIFNSKIFDNVAKVYNTFIIITIHLIRIAGSVSLTGADQLIKLGTQRRVIRACQLDMTRFFGSRYIPSFLPRTYSLDTVERLEPLRCDLWSRNQNRYTNVSGFRLVPRVFLEINDL